MRRYHWRVSLLTLGVLLGFGSAIARFGFGYPMGPGCWSEHHGHRYAHHHDCACDEPAAGKSDVR